MLKKSKKITIEGVVVINDTEVASLRAILDTENPNDMTMYETVRDKEAVKANRAAYRADRAEFEDYAYSVQDEEIAEFGV